MRVLDRKLLRELWTAKGQALAVTAVILCGVASFVSVMACYRNLRLTQEAYYERYGLADFWVPLERSPVTAVSGVAAMPGALRAQGRLVRDVNLDVPGNPDPVSGRLISITVDAPAVNGLHLVSGRFLSPGVLNEVIVNDRFARENRLAPGDVISATMNDRKQPLRIIGTALSPEYVYAIRDPRDFLPNPARFGILWVSRDFAEMALGMRQAVNEVVGFLEPTARPEAVLDRVEHFLEPYGARTSVLRKDQLSNYFLSNEIEQLRTTGTVTPAIFLSIAALILTIMLDRLVARERTQIGVFKACGYPTAALAGHYLKFAALLSGVGGCAGALAGHWLAGLLMRMYVTFFEFPILRHRFYGDLTALAVMISLAAGVAGTLVAVWRVARVQPAEAMRGAAPRPGHRTLLERWGFLWRQLGFTGKMIVRNIARYRARAAFTVFGVFCSTVIVLFGRFYIDCADSMLDLQFNTLQRQDVTVNFHTERGRAALFEARRMPHVRRAEPQLNYPFRLTSAWRWKEVAITGLQPDGRLVGLLDTRGRPIDLGDDGLVLDEFIAAHLGVRPGDTLVAKPLLGRVTRDSTVRVRSVVQQYIGLGAYMNIRALSRLLDEPYALNAVLLDVDAGEGAALNRYLKDVPAVAAVGLKHESQRRIEETMVQSMTISNAIFSVFAGIIAFAIIYNATVIALTERTRELASLRVLGFRLGEVRRIVFGENLLLTALGVVVGLPVGYLLCRWTVRLYDTELFRFPFTIHPATFAAVVGSVAAYVLAANLAVRHRINRLDMVEVLKGRE